MYHHCTNMVFFAKEPHRAAGRYSANKTPLTGALLVHENSRGAFLPVINNYRSRASGRNSPLDLEMPMNPATSSDKERIWVSGMRKTRILTGLARRSRKCGTPKSMITRREQVSLSSPRQLPRVCRGETRANQRRNFGLRRLEVSEVPCQFRVNDGFAAGRGVYAVNPELCR